MGSDQDPRVLASDDQACNEDIVNAKYKVGRGWVSRLSALLPKVR